MLTYGSPSNAPNAQAPKPKHNYLELLIQKHEEQLRQKSGGIDYQAVLAQSRHRWPFVEFVKQLAAHLARSGGVAAFSSEEMEHLQKVYQRLSCLDAVMLEEACQRAQQRSIPEIVFLLQQLAQERERRP